MQEEDPRDLEDSADEFPVIRLLKRMARGEEVTFEEAHEVAEKLDSVIIGDVEHCRHKIEQYRNIGCDRLLCLTQFGRVPHEAVMRSIRLIGQHLTALCRTRGTGGRVTAGRTVLPEMERFIATKTAPTRRGSSVDARGT